MGDALLQKTYTVDFLKKKRIKNNGEMPQYYVEDDHEAIIPRALFLQVQEEIARRGSQVDCMGRRRGFSAKHCFTGFAFTVLNAGNNSAESIGITEAANLWCGDV